MNTSMGKKIMKKRIKGIEENVKVLYVYVFCFLFFFFVVVVVVLFCFVLLSVVVVQKVIIKRKFAEE